MFSVVSTFVFVVLSLFTVYLGFAAAKKKDFIIAVVQALWSFYYFGYCIVIVRSGHKVADQVIQFNRSNFWIATFFRFHRERVQRN